MDQQLFALNALLGHTPGGGRMKLPDDHNRNGAKKIKGKLSQSGATFAHGGKEYRVSAALPGDWKCFECGFPAVRAKNGKCNVCRAARPQNPTYAAPPAATPTLHTVFPSNAPTSPSSLIVVKRPPLSLSGLSPPLLPTPLSYAAAAAAAAAPVAATPPVAPSPAPPLAATTAFTDSSAATTTTTTTTMTTMQAQQEHQEAQQHRGADILEPAVLKSCQMIIASGALQGAGLAAILAKVQAHDAACEAKKVADQLQRVVKKNGNEPLHPLRHLSTCQLLVAECLDAVAKHAVKVEASTKQRAEDHASNLRVLRDTVAAAEKRLQEQTVHQDETDRLCLDADARAAEALRQRLASAQAELQQAQIMVDTASATSPSTDDDIAEHNHGPPSLPHLPPTATAAPQPPHITLRPLIQPPALTLELDDASRARLLHARMVVDQYQQQDTHLPLDLQALQLTARELASLVGDTAWSQAYGGRSPLLAEPLPRFIIGVVGTALRQLEIDVAARAAAVEAAQNTMLQLTRTLPNPTSPPPAGSALGTSLQPPVAEVKQGGCKREAAAADLGDTEFLEKVTKREMLTDQPSHSAVTADSSRSVPEPLSSPVV